MGGPPAGADHAPISVDEELRNRIHRLLGGQHELKLPQYSDLFGRKGVGFLERLGLPAPARLLFTQQLTLLKELAVRIRCNENKIPVKPRITHNGLIRPANGGNLWPCNPWMALV